MFTDANLRVFEDCIDTLELASPGALPPFPHAAFGSLPAVRHWPDRRLWGLILRATSLDAVEWLEGLVALGVDPDLRPASVNGECAWFVGLGRARNSQTAIRYLLSPKGPGVGVAARGTEKSALSYALRHRASPAMVKLLFEAGADPDEKAVDGYALLVSTLLSRDIAPEDFMDLLPVFLDAGMDLSLFDNDKDNKEGARLAIGTLVGGYGPALQALVGEARACREKAAMDSVFPAVTGVLPRARL